MLGRRPYRESSAYFGFAMQVKQLCGIFESDSREVGRTPIAELHLIAAPGVPRVDLWVRAAVCDGSTDSLGNGGFETPAVPAERRYALGAGETKIARCKGEVILSAGSIGSVLSWSSAAWAWRAWRRKFPATDIDRAFDEADTIATVRMLHEAP